MDKRKKVLITGAAGFLGSHLCEMFVKKGYHVVAMDNLITGRIENIEHLFPLENFEFCNHDITKFIHVPGQLDYILHFASPASPIDYLKIPIQTLKVGSLGIHNCLGLAKAKNARILIASTSEVYGDPTVHPQPESYWGNVNPVGPRGVYDEAKRFQEAITMAYHTFHGLETRIVRIFNTYGPKMRLNDGRVLPAFIGQALRGEDLTIFGDGSQTRSFCYVDDLMEGIYALLHSDCSDPVNIGNPSEISIKDFASEILELTGTNQKLILKELPVDDPKQRQPDITLAKKLLNWSPKVDRSEGLKRTYEYFKDLSQEELRETAHYNFDKYKTDTDKKLNKIYLYHPKRSFKKVIEDALYIATVQNEIRSLINMPANLLNSNVYSKYIKSNIPKKIKLKVYDEKVLNDKILPLQFVSGSHFAVKAAAYHNFLLNNDKKLQDKYEFMKSGTKIKYYVCKDKTINDTFAYARGSYPIEFAPEIDYDIQFEKSILSPVNSIIEPLGMPEITRRLSVVMDIFGGFK